MTSRQLILVLVVLIGLGILFTAGRLLIEKPKEKPSPTPSVTLEPTPSPNSNATSKVAIGSKISALSIVITPLEVVEDSRCGIDVQCIQAGTVRLKAEVGIENSTSTRPILKLNEPYQVGGRTVTLTDVLPAPRAGVKIPAANYTFTFEVK